MASPELQPAAASTPQIPAPELFLLVGKNALITGGSRGIGRAMAIALAEAGASVCIAQRDLENTATADAIRAKGGKAQMVQCDLRNMEEAKGVFQKALDVMDGRIDILINCSGLLKRKPSLEVSEEEWDSVRFGPWRFSFSVHTRLLTDFKTQVVDVNLKALFFVCQAAGAHMVPRREGKIVNVASLNSFIGGETVASYAASKGAVSQLTKALSNEWAKYNIQVNAIAPGSIAADM
jgi:2-dehydro-3-deoxy-D-gluconate 5-dehydrogenase